MVELRLRALGRSACFSSCRAALSLSLVRYCCSVRPAVRFCLACPILRLKRFNVAARAGRSIASFVAPLALVDSSILHIAGWSFRCFASFSPPLPAPHSFRFAAFCFFPRIACRASVLVSSSFRIRYRLMRCLYRFRKRISHD